MRAMAHDARLDQSSNPKVADAPTLRASWEQLRDAARARNVRLQAEVRDLLEGLEMVEEKARAELGMVKPNEIYVQIAR